MTAEAEPESYSAFRNSFGPILKEGIHENPDHRDEIVHIAHFHTTFGERLIGLDTYVGRMKEDQEAIYFITRAELEGCVDARNWRASASSASRYCC